MEALQRAQTYLSTFEVPTKQFVFQRAKAGYQPMYAIRSQVRLHVARVENLIQWPMTATPSWRKGFLAGIFDAEGSYSRGILRLYNTSPDIIDTITESFRCFGFDYAIEIRPGDNKPVPVVRLLGGVVEQLRFFLTMNPAITRKMDIAGQAIKNQARLRVTAVKPLGLSMPMFDMTTGTGDFIANGVVSHNCYARPTHEYFGFGAGTDFERKLFVKPRAPELLEQAFRHPSWRGERIMLSGVTDCYQPLEAAWKLTRRCLEVCVKYRNPVSIVTKSLLIRRDVDVLAALAREADCSVSLSIPFLDERIARIIEPGAPTIRRRFETMRILADAGLPVGIGVAPIIPGLNDSDIPGLLKEAKRCGASFAFKVLLRLPGSVKAVFFHRLEEVLSLRAAKIEHRIRETRDGELYDSRFGHRHAGTGEYWELIEQTWELWIRRLGLNQEEDAPRPSTFHRPPTEAPQLQFSWSTVDYA
jgi:DNA repair photolyase